MAGVSPTGARVLRVAYFLVLLLICTSCGETYRPVANPILPNQPNPGFSHIALVLSSNGPSHPGASTTIDVSGDTAVAQSAVGLMPVHAALVQNGTRVYVANSVDDTVSNYAPVSPTPVVTISLPAGSVPDFVNTTEAATVYVADSGNATVSAISTTANVVTNSIPVGTNPVAMAELPNEQKLYVASQGSSTIAGSVTSINTIDKSVNGNVPLTTYGWVSPVWTVARSDSARVYVLDSGSGMVVVIDTSSDSVVNSVSVGAGANFMLYDPVRDRLYVTNPATSTVTFLDASTDMLTPLTVNVANPVSVAALPDGSRVYVVSATVSAGTVASMLTVLNAGDGSIRTTIPLTSVPQICAQTRFELVAVAAADSSRIYVGNCDAGNTSIIQTSDDTLLLQMPAPVSAAQPSTVDITAASQNGTNTTYAYTLVSGAPLRVGMSIAIASMGNAGNDGTFTIKSMGSGTFTVMNPSGVTASSQDGTGTAVTPQNPVFVLAGP
jgi:YVTN family beta-propeller protein